MKSRRFFEILLSLLLCAGMAFLCLKCIGDRQAGLLYRDAERLAFASCPVESFPAEQFFCRGGIFPP